MKIIDRIFSENPTVVRDAFVKEEARRHLVGLLIEAKKGKISMREANKIVRKKLWG